MPAIHRHGKGILLFCSLESGLLTGKYGDRCRTTAGRVSEGLEAGDVDHRGDREMCFTISEKARLRRRPTRWGRP